MRTIEYSSPTFLICEAFLFFFLVLSYRKTKTNKMRDGILFILVASGFGVLTSALHLYPISNIDTSLCITLHRIFSQVATVFGLPSFLIGFAEKYSHISLWKSSSVLQFLPFLFLLLAFLWEIPPIFNTLAVGASLLFLLFHIFVSFSARIRDSLLALLAIFLIIFETLLTLFFTDQHRFPIFSSFDLTFVDILHISLALGIYLLSTMRIQHIKNK